MSVTTPRPTAPRSVRLRMSPRDLISIGIFAALYIVVVMGISMFGFVSPVVMLVALAAAIVAGGVPFMLFLTRVSHAGMITVFAVITSGVLLLSGHPPVSFALTVALALVAEVIVWAGGYTSRRMSVLAHTVYAAWFIGPMLPIFYAPDDYYGGPSMQQMGQAYTEQMQALLSPGVLLAFCASTVVFGFLGGLLGARLLRKHFEKAGLA